MKVFVQLTLFIFISFLATPTFISMLDKEVDTSCFYNFSEEEENHVNFNEVKVVHNENYTFSNFFCKLLNSQQFLHFDESLNGTFQATILLPPPELS